MPPQGITESQMAEYLFPETDLNLSSSQDLNLSQFTNEQLIDNKLVYYLKPLNSDKPVDPHAWWRDNLIALPKLSRLAYKYLSLN